jgi:predicted dehydrogenase
MDMKHKVLLLGLGFWGRRWLDLIQETDRVQLAGISGKPGEIQEACEKYGLSEGMAYADYKEAIEKTDADIAVVVIPGVLHYDADRRAMGKGMHVITEKPLAMSMDEARGLLEIKRRHAGLKFMTCQNYRWRTYNQTIKKAITDGLVGDLETILVEFRQQEDLQGYRAGLEQPLLQDVSIHHFDLIRFFTDAKLKSIFCTSYRPSWSIFNGRPNTDAVIELERGIRVVYNGSWAARGRQSLWDGNFAITGSKGCITLTSDSKVRFYRFAKAGEVELDVQVETGEELAQVTMPYTEMAYGLHHMLDCIEADKVPETTLEDNIHSYDMVYSGLQSVQSGKAESSKI